MRKSLTLSFMYACRVITKDPARMSAAELEAHVSWMLGLTLIWLLVAAVLAVWLASLMPQG